MIPNDESIEWTNGAGSLHLVERVVPDALAGRQIHQFNVGDTVRVVGMVRGVRDAWTSANFSPKRTTCLNFWSLPGHPRPAPPASWRPTVRVVVAGGGSVGTAISLDLVDRHHDVTLLEHMSATAEKLKSLLPGVNVMGR